MLRAKFSWTCIAMNLQKQSIHGWSRVELALCAVSWNCIFEDIGREDTGCCSTVYWHFRSGTVTLFFITAFLCYKFLHIITQVSEQFPMRVSTQNFFSELTGWLVGQSKISRKDWLRRIQTKEVSNLCVLIFALQITSPSFDHRSFWASLLKNCWSGDLCFCINTNSTHCVFFLLTLLSVQGWLDRLIANLNEIISLLRL